MNIETENDRLVITAAGADRQGLVERLTGKIADSGCNIEESRMAVLGGERQEAPPRGRGAARKAP